MKKLSALLIAVSFCILSAGNVLANDSQVNVKDHQGVWTSWFDENGNRIPDTIAKMHADRKKTERASTDLEKNSPMSVNPEKFGFIQKTKTFDYSKDSGSET